ncbi:unnamed protein product [Urochloa humidicola]
MDLLRDGAVVRLQSRARGAYLHADEDGVGVSRGGDTCIHLRGAAYGRYLSLSADLKTRRRAVVQREFAAPGHPGAMWMPVSIWAEDGRRFVLLRHVFGALALSVDDQATGCVSADYQHYRPSRVMQWAVEIEAPPQTPVSSPSAVANLGFLCGILGLIRVLGTRH